jgi:hypothetical protein
MQRCYKTTGGESRILRQNPPPIYIPRQAPWNPNAYLNSFSFRYSSTLVELKPLFFISCMY